MKISVRTITDYKEVTIYDGGTTLCTGFLDEKERRALAAELIEAAEDLMYGLEDK